MIILAYNCIIINFICNWYFYKPTNRTTPILREKANFDVYLQMVVKN